MKKIAIVAAFSVLLTGATARAFPAYTGECVTCHPQAANVGVTLSNLNCFQGNLGYRLDVTNTNPGIEGWGVFEGPTKVRSGYGAAGSGSVPGQATYTFYGVSGFGSGSGLTATSNFVTYTAECPPAPSCTDVDGDSFTPTLQTGCKQQLDCNDDDFTIHPGAVEVVRDGIDQDCNGYDNTILVTKATWSRRTGTLTVEASSLYGSSANLVVAGIGPEVGVMVWNKKKQLWTLTAVTSYDPGTVSVQGFEGSLVAGVATVR